MWPKYFTVALPNSLFIRLMVSFASHIICGSKGLRQEVVNHGSAFIGHPGATKTEVKILPNFFWPGLRQDVIRFCRSYDEQSRRVMSKKYD